jgi:pilus assembly protein CpaF
MSAELVKNIRRVVATRLVEERNRNAELDADPELDHDRAVRFIKDEIDAYVEQQLRTNPFETPLTRDEEHELERSVLDYLFGLGPIQRLIDDPNIENININGCDRVFVKYSDGTKKMVDPVADTDEELVSLIHVAATYMGHTERQFNPTQPQLDLRLTAGGDSSRGHRLSAVMSVTPRPSLSIRRHRFLEASSARLEQLVKLDAIDERLMAFFRAAVRARKTMVIAGGTNAGKTTLLRALANEIPQYERLVTIEKAFELGLDEFSELHPDVVALEAREANTEGKGEVTMSQLVRRGLRMDPDRVIVGEVLGDEIIDMLNAMSQGNDGSLCTIHANSTSSVFERMCSYAVQSEAHLPREATMQLIAGAVSFAVFVGQSYRTDENGNRRLDRFVSSIREVHGIRNGELETVEVFGPRASDGRAVPTGEIACANELAREGYEPWMHRLSDEGDAWKA